MSLRLLTWGPDWGVASVEPKCLSVLAYLRFAKITSVTVETTKELYSTALYHQRGSRIFQSCFVNYLVQ
eukprot:m.27654 g.27654  ORF g.27654 m.27654 type:complete len:69 (+) comp7916_c0_seq2:70-276(+)